MPCPHCTDHLPLSVRVARIETRCKYHPREGLVYGPAALVPNGLCRELFCAAYPEALAVLYNGRPRRLRPRQQGQAVSFARCPAPGGVRVAVRCRDKLPPPLRVAKELAEEACKVLFRPVDAHFRGVTIEVLEVGPACHKGYEPGRRFEFNVGDTRQLCPAGFAAIQPHVGRLAASGADQAPLTVHCPDWVGVTYEIRLDAPGATPP
ncbi:MAG: hypothetical protein HQL82_06150 [Magnetococcales bacterium]|nr:hypothetical protein [Magnetococcales bacterium]